MNPLAVEIWFYIALAYVLVSLTIWIVARFSPFEWQAVKQPCEPVVDVMGGFDSGGDCGGVTAKSHRRRYNEHNDWRPNEIHRRSSTDDGPPHIFNKIRKTIKGLPLNMMKTTDAEGGNASQMHNFPDLTHHYSDDCGGGGDDVCGNYERSTNRGGVAFHHHHHHQCNDIDMNDGDDCCSQHHHQQQCDCDNLPDGFEEYNADDIIDCHHETELMSIDNDFTLTNSFWFAIGTLMQQGSDLNPKVFFFLVHKAPLKFLYAFSAILHKVKLAYMNSF